MDLPFLNHTPGQTPAPNAGGDFWGSGDAAGSNDDATLNDLLALYQTANEPAPPFALEPQAHPAEPFAPHAMPTAHPVEHHAVPAEPMAMPAHGGVADPFASPAHGGVVDPFAAPGADAEIDELIKSFQLPAEPAFAPQAHAVVPQAEPVFAPPAEPVFAPAPVEPMHHAPVEPIHQAPVIHETVYPAIPAEPVFAAAPPEPVFAPAPPEPVFAPAPVEPVVHAPVAPVHQAPPVAPPAPVAPAIPVEPIRAAVPTPMPAMTMEVPMTGALKLSTSEERHAAMSNLTTALQQLTGGIDQIQSQLATLYEGLAHAAAHRAPVTEIVTLTEQLTATKNQVGENSPLWQHALVLRQAADAYMQMLKTL